jgi:hypothetical protein
MQILNKQRLSGFGERVELKMRSGYGGLIEEQEITAGKRLSHTVSNVSSFYGHPVGYQTQELHAR